MTVDTTTEAVEATASSLDINADEVAILTQKRAAYIKTLLRALAQERDAARGETLQRVTEIVGEISLGAHGPRQYRATFPGVGGGGVQTVAVPASKVEGIYETIYDALRRHPDYQPLSVARAERDAAQAEVERLKAEVAAREAAAFQRGAEAMREKAAAIVAPKKPRPCDCTSCDCGNSGDQAWTAAWDADTASANAIRALPVPEDRHDQG